MHRAFRPGSSIGCPGAAGANADCVNRIPDSVSTVRPGVTGRAIRLAEEAQRLSALDVGGDRAFNQGSNQDAVDAFQKALSLSPNYPVALKGEVQLLYQAQDKLAIPLLERILKANPKDEIAQEMLANLEEKQGNCEAAIDHFLLSTEAIRTHPGSLEAYGYCLLQTKQPQKAIPVFEQLAALLPERTYPKYDLAVVLVEAKQNEAALKVLEPLLAVDSLTRIS